MAKDTPLKTLICWQSDYLHQILYLCHHQRFILDIIACHAYIAPPKEDCSGKAEH